MRIIQDKPVTPITLNEIPVGMVFTGTIVSKDTGNRYQGRFLKHLGAHRIKMRGGAFENFDCIVLRLDPVKDNTSGLFLHCSRVENYKPYPNATLDMKGE